MEDAQKYRDEFMEKKFELQYVKRELDLLKQSMMEQKNDGSGKE